jgi:hypothetical protein
MKTIGRQLKRLQTQLPESGRRTYNEIVKRRSARNIVGIWLALGLFSLASCSPITLGNSSADKPGGAQVGSSSSSAAPATRFDSNAPIDSGQSQALTNYLHNKQLPLVGARVLAANGASRQVILYGYVRTPFGKADAADQARQFLKDSSAQVDNRLKIEPELGGSTPGSTASDSGNLAGGNGSDLNNPDLQQYQQQQQQQTAQQQQYMNQGGMGSLGSSMGSPGLMMMLPFLLGGTSFGGSGMGFGMGGGGFGSPYGSGMGSPYGGSGYPPGYGYPSSGYGNPYGP